MEGTVFIVNTGADKVGKHVVFIGGADQLIHRQAHFHGVVGRQNVAEIPGGNHDVDLLALIVHFPGAH